MHINTPLCPKKALAEIVGYPEFGPANPDPVTYSFLIAEKAGKSDIVAQRSQQAAEDWKQALSQFCDVKNGAVCRVHVDVLPTPAESSIAIA